MPKTKGTPRKLTAFRLSDEEMRKLEELAVHREKTKSDVIREMIGRSHATMVRAS